MEIEYRHAYFLSQIDRNFSLTIRFEWNEMKAKYEFIKALLAMNADRKWQWHHVNWADELYCYVNDFSLELSRILAGLKWAVWILLR